MPIGRQLEDAPVKRLYFVIAIILVIKLNHMSYSIEALLVRRCMWALAGQWLTATLNVKWTAQVNVSATLLFLALSLTLSSSFSRLLSHALAYTPFVRTINWTECDLCASFRGAHRFNKIKWNRLRCAACGRPSLVRWDGAPNFLNESETYRFVVRWCVCVLCASGRGRNLLRFTITFCTIHKSILLWGIPCVAVATVIRCRQKRVTFYVSLRQSPSLVCVVHRQQQWRYCPKVITANNVQIMFNYFHLMRLRMSCVWFHFLAPRPGHLRQREETPTECFYFDLNFKTFFVASEMGSNEEKSTQNDHDKLMKWLGLTTKHKLFWVLPRFGLRYSRDLYFHSFAVFRKKKGGWKTHGSTATRANGSDVHAIKQQSHTHTSVEYGRSSRPCLVPAHGYFVFVFRYVFNRATRLCRLSAVGTVEHYAQS